MSGVTPLFILMESHYGSQRQRQRAMNQLLCYEIKIELLATPNPCPSWETGMGRRLRRRVRPGWWAPPNQRAGGYGREADGAVSGGDNSHLHLVQRFPGPGG